MLIKSTLRALLRPDHLALRLFSIVLNPTQMDLTVAINNTDPRRNADLFALHESKAQKYKVR